MKLRSWISSSHLFPSCVRSEIDCCVTWYCQYWEVPHWSCSIASRKYLERVVSDLVLCCTVRELDFVSNMNPCKLSFKSWKTCKWILFVLYFSSFLSCARLSMSLLLSKYSLLTSNSAIWLVSRLCGRTGPSWSKGLHSIHRLHQDNPDNALGLIAEMYIYAVECHFGRSLSLI